jgi:hypothetical protein
VRDVQSKPPAGGALRDRDRHFGVDFPRDVHRTHIRRAAVTDGVVVDVSTGKRLTVSPGRDVAKVLVGAAEICLLERSPRLAIRAAWLLLRSNEESDADLLVEPAAHG